MKRTISLLGSTGSIGRQTLQVARELGLTVAALAANSSVDLLEQQIREFKPRLAVLYEMEAAAELAKRIRGTETRVAYGMEGLLEAASMPEADTVVTALMGMVGLRPTLAAIQSGKRIALANKETLVCAGELVMREAKEHGVEIVPVDSEHSAIFQCLQGCRDRGEVRRLVLTCSGGPFFGKKTEELQGVTRKDALRHPNWSMGPKITPVRPAAGAGERGGAPPEHYPLSGGVPGRRHAGPDGYAGHEAAHPLRHDMACPRRESR